MLSACPNAKVQAQLVMAVDEFVEALLAQHGIVVPPDELLELSALYRVLVAWSQMLEGIANSFVEPVSAVLEIEE